MNQPPRKGTAPADETDREEVGVVVPADVTARAGAAGGGQHLNLVSGAAFLSYTLLEPLQVSSREADLWFVRRAEVDYVLKLYRFGFEPKQQLTDRLKALALNHAVRMEEHGKFGDRAYEIQEKVALGDLGKLAKPLPRPMLKEVLKELAEAVSHLHAEGIIHRDLKPSNILMRSLEPLNLVLTDFGISILSEEAMRKSSSSRTRRYGAPEALKGVVSTASDWWSVGVIVLEYLQGVRPLEGMDEHMIDLQLLTKGIPVPADLSSEWSELLKGLLTRDHEKRWQSTQVRNWLQGQRGQATHYEGDLQQTHKHKPYQFGEKQIYTAKELAVALSEDWDAGVKNFERGFVSSWVKDELENQDLAARLLDIYEDKGLSGDEKQSLALVEMDRSLPAMWKGNAVNREWAAREPEQFKALLHNRIRARLEKQNGWPTDLIKRLTEVKAAKLSPGYQAAMERIVITGELRLKIGGWEVTPEALDKEPEKWVVLLESKLPALHQQHTGETWLEKAAGRWTRAQTLGAERNWLWWWACTGKPLLSRAGTALSPEWLASNPDEAVILLKSPLPKFWADQTGETWLAESEERWARAKTLEATQDWLWWWACTGKPLLSRAGTALSPEWLAANPEQAVALLESPLPKFWTEHTGETWLAQAAGEWLNLWQQVDALGCGTSKSAALPWIIGSSETLVTETQRRLQQYAGATSVLLNRLWDGEQLDAAQCITLCAAEEGKLLTPEAKAAAKAKAEAQAEAKHESESMAYLRSFGVDMDFQLAKELIKTNRWDAVELTWLELLTDTEVGSQLKSNSKLKAVLEAAHPEYVDVVGVCAAYGPALKKWKEQERELRELRELRCAAILTGSFRKTAQAMQRANVDEEIIVRRFEQGGTVVAWGKNGDGQATVPAGLHGVVDITAGDTHTVALRANGTGEAWGANGLFSRNLLVYNQGRFPAELNGVAAVAAGGSHTVVLKDDGTVEAWGDNDKGQTKVPDGLTGVVAIAAGEDHTVALKANGKVVAWGSNSDGQTRVPNGLTGVVAIAAGVEHTVALKVDGTVVAWGWHDKGQTKVSAMHRGVVAIAAGDHHTVALKANGKVVAWGLNQVGQTKIPAGLTGVVDIAAGGGHTVALKADGTVVAWGDNDEGQTEVPDGLNGVVAIAAGQFHTVALKLD